LKSPALDAEGEVDGVIPHAEKTTEMAIAAANCKQNPSLGFLLQQSLCFLTAKKPDPIAKGNHPELLVSLPI
jgi:hypothetical protein